MSERIQGFLISPLHVSRRVATLGLVALAIWLLLLARRVLQRLLAAAPPPPPAGT